MLRRSILIIAATIGFSLSLFFISDPALAGAMPTAEYLCKLGATFYQQGRYEEALHEFDKALMLDPKNQTAKKYINDIFLKINPPKSTPGFKVAQAPAREAVSPVIKQRPSKRVSRDDAMKDALNSARQFEKRNKEAALKDSPKDKVKSKDEKKAILSGEYRVALGFTPNDVVWKDANADRVGVPREKNWRYLWGDKRENTYDPKIYDRLTLDMETQFKNPLNAFMEVTVDPWTFVGKNKVTVQSGADSVNIDLKYWSADSRTINETYRSDQGQIVHLKQIKVDHHGKSTLSGLCIAPTNAPFGSISPMDINREYRPIRKLWFDYKQLDYTLKVFPLSDEFEALTSDDPLRLSNNHVYWEESPWLDQYEPSQVFNSANQPLKEGKWIRKLSYFSKDSSDDYPHRLTFLRGASFKSNTGAYSLEATLATPMSLWDEYQNSNSVDGALRFKIPFDSNLKLGATLTSKLGIHGGGLDASNYVGALDANYSFGKNNIYAEVAGSYKDIKQAKGFSTTNEGQAEKLGFTYDDSKEKKNGFYKSEIYLAHMDNKFYPGLSNYRYTRNEADTFSKHIFFADIKDDDWSLMWGDGIDRGRNVVGFKLGAKAFNEKLDTDVRYRNVHKDSGKYIESVTRVESTYKATPKLTSKLLAYYQHLPKTHANKDPLMYAKTMYSLTDYFSEEDIFAENASIIDDKDPSVGSFGLGGKYDFNQEMSLEGIYERTNDPLDFPRGLLNDLSVSTETRDGVVWDKVTPFLYDQKFFDLPPYHYYNIARTRFVYTPEKEWEFILSYTFNENKYSTGLDNNINHFGFEAQYVPTDKLTFWSKYIYSKLIDVYKQNQYQRSDFYEGHHNVFFGADYKFNKDENLTILYGEFVGYNDPYEQTNWTLSTVDTQHIFRIFYKRKF